MPIKKIACIRMWEGSTEPNNPLKGWKSFQSCDEFLHNLFHTDATLDEGTVPDIKVMENDINMMSSEVNANSLLDFFNQITSKSSSSIATGMPIKEEPLTEDDLKALQKDRQKKDNHNLSKFFLLKKVELLFWNC